MDITKKELPFYWKNKGLIAGKDCTLVEMTGDVHDIEELANSILKECRSSRYALRWWWFLGDIATHYGELNALRKEALISQGWETPPVATCVGDNLLPDYGVRVIGAVFPADHITIYPSSPRQCSAQQYGASFSRGMTWQSKGGNRLFALSGTAAISKEGKSEFPYSRRQQKERVLEIYQDILQQWSGAIAQRIWWGAPFPTSDTETLIPATLCRPELIVEAEAVGYLV